MDPRRAHQGPAHLGPESPQGPGSHRIIGGPQGPREAHNSPGGPTRARPTRAEGVGHTCPRGPTRAKGNPQGPRPQEPWRPTMA